MPVEACGAALLLGARQASGGQAEREKELCGRMVISNLLNQCVFR